MSLKKILDFFLVCMTIVATLFVGIYVYYTLKDNGLYTNSTSTYVASYTDPQTGEKVNPLSVNYYENHNNSGKEVVELVINGYSDQYMQAIYGRGYQLVIDKENGNELYYCDTYDGASWTSMHPYDETTENGQNKNFYYVSINDKLYAIRLDGTYSKDETRVDGTKVVLSIFTGGLAYLISSLANGNWGLTTTTSKTYYYTMEDLLLHFKDVAKSCSYGAGDYTLPVVDLGNYIHVYNVDDVGTADPEPIGVDGQINSYFSIDFHYDRRGMSYADQSMFDSVAGDSNFNVTGIDFDVNYWKSTTVYNLNESDFVYRYSSVDLGYYYSLSSKTISELKNFDNLEIYVTFDISAFKNVNVLGFDYYALHGIKVAGLKITSSTQRDFTLLVGALQDTGLTKIDTEKVNIINLSGTEVVA